MKKIFQYLLATMIGFNAMAQPGTKKDALAILQKLVQSYQPPGGLSFNITYKYAMEESPAVMLDSLSGQFKLNGDKYWYQLDNTESIKTNECLVMIFRDDDIMYLAKPSTNIMTNPLAMIDSLLFQKNSLTYRINDGNELQQLVLDFPLGSAYKRLEYFIDKRTGYLVKMVSTVNQSLMSALPPTKGEEGNEKYAVVEAQFSGYRQGGIDNTLFDAARYFKKDGNEYIAVGAFEQFRVFLGSAGM
jgi:hypothetical protein